MKMIKTGLAVILYCALFFMTVIAGAEKMIEHRTGGTIQIDAVYIDDDKAELIPGSGTEVRRARFFLSGQHDKTWAYKLRETIIRSGVEISSVLQSISVQTEVILIDLNKNDTSNDLKFSGSYYLYKLVSHWRTKTLQA